MSQPAAAEVLPPLVNPGADLTREEIQRYSRHLLLPEIGRTGQRRLKNSKVAVMGAGGLGAPVMLYLAAAGVGTIGIVDFDIVEESNLQRQVIHTVSDVGRLKTTSAAESIGAINPLVTVVEHRLRLDATNALQVLGDYDLVVDGTDNFATRYLVNDACVILGLPYVWGSIFRFEGQVSVFWANHGPQYRDVFPHPPPPGSVPSCAEGGVLGVLCGSIGSTMATEAIKMICGIGRPLLGRLLVYDALEMSHRLIHVRPDPQGEPVSHLADYEELCEIDPEATTMACPDSQVAAQVLRLLLDSQQPPWLIDVRESAEFDIVALPGAVLVPLGEITSGREMPRLRDLAASRDLVVYCKSGARSASAVQVLQEAGLCNVTHLKGGILEWISLLDQSLPTY
ncbi:molybdopterin-synthase adenylyltransferase MoeB [Nakamurella antarctica]|uniref:Molybdopterin-synthase adenylyltransferase MoeB n=1 Tax=Nakamurella antarctica TaxID=1902245 RepID=A0A3G8ZQI5_9ACTN|nr:molybdopterin-synthase adenylyltransferase MoeB [Nakamurella antarctica]